MKVGELLVPVWKWYHDHTCWIRYKLYKWVLLEHNSTWRECFYANLSFHLRQETTDYQFFLHSDLLEASSASSEVPMTQIRSQWLSRCQRPHRGYTERRPTNPSVLKMDERWKHLQETQEVEFSSPVIFSSLSFGVFVPGASSAGTFRVFWMKEKGKQSRVAR